MTATTDASAFAEVLALAPRRARLGRLDRRGKLRIAPDTRRAGLLRLAAHGVPTAVVRHGDDLAARAVGASRSRRWLVRRTFLASLLPALAIAATWLSLEDPRLVGEGLAVAMLAIVPALARRGAIRIVAVVLSALGAAWIAFGAEPWELLPVPRRARPRTGGCATRRAGSWTSTTSSCPSSPRRTRRCTRSSSSRSSGSWLAWRSSSQRAGRSARLR